MRELSEDDIHQRIDMLIKPLTNKTRQKILLLLSDGPVTYSEVLDKLKLESGSFYWHIKKMKLLIDQTEDRKYILSDKGEQAYKLLFGPQDNMVDTFPEWFKSLNSYVTRIISSPTWLITQQILLIYLFTTLLFYFTGIYQFGTRVDAVHMEFYVVFLSIILSLSIVNLIQLIIVIIQLNIGGTKWKIPVKPLFRLFMLNYIFLSPILFTGIISGLLSLIYPAIIHNILLQFILNMTSIILSVLFSTSLLMTEFDNTYRSAFIISLITFYPVVILSFTI